MKPALLAATLAALLFSACRRNPVEPPINPPTFPAPQWTVYKKNNSALPDDQVNAIAIDKNNVKWIGTANGLCRISGTAWTVFTEGNAGLPSSFIRAVATAADGTVWVGTDKGVARLQNGQWTTYTTANSSMTANGVLCITHDAARNITWLATSKDLIRVDGQNNWERLDALEDDIVISMAAGGDGSLWLGTFNHFSFRGRLRKLSGGQWTTYQLDQLGYPSTFPHSIGVDKNNRPVAVLGGTSVRAVVRLQAGAWQEVPGPFTGASKALLLEEDKVWVGGDNISLYGSVQNPSFALPEASSGILAMALDARQKKWLGTTSRGLIVYE